MELSGDEALSPAYFVSVGFEVSSVMATLWRPDVMSTALVASARKILCMHVEAINLHLGKVLRWKY